MTRYFFDVHDGVDVRDDVGFELPDIVVAQYEALRIASGFGSNTKLLGDQGGAVIVVVRDEADATVLTARLVLSIDPAHRPVAV